MELSTFTIIFLFIVCLAGGVVIGVMFSRFMKSAAETPAEKKEEKDRPPSLDRRLSQEVEKGVVRLGRNEKHEIWLEMDGQRLKNRNKVTPEQKKVLAGFMGDLSDWLDINAFPSSDTPAYEPIPAENSVFSRSFSPPRLSKKKTSLPLQEAVIPLASKSIVQQIDEILQKKLAGTDFSKLDIRLLEGPSGEVNVQIGAVKHLGVDAIPNHEIQALIRQAVVDWEDGVK